MKANELRIGNKLMYSDNSVIWTVAGIHEFGIDCFDEIEETYIEYENFEPIPLTEEWLLKLGFKKENTTIYSICDNLSSSEVGKWYFFKNENNSFTPYIKRENKFSWIGTDIKYIHQLQNLYFALTGEELTNE